MDGPGLPAGPGRAAPRGRSEWLRVTRRRWVAFWALPLAEAILPGMEPPVRRLFDLVDERERLRRLADGRVIEGIEATIAGYTHGIDALVVRVSVTSLGRLHAALVVGTDAPTVAALALAVPDTDAAIELLSSFAARAE